ncbi:hypothetical protein HD806DRAFT_544093 [Xylariaceae sp. AK1471]|nr:hypothetical protein HD806DRAFT_544093 [Xylariaceae sp. AK1471]
MSDRSERIFALLDQSRRLRAAGTSPAVLLELADEGARAILASVPAGAAIVPAPEPAVPVTTTTTTASSSAAASPSVSPSVSPSISAPVSAAAAGPNQHLTCRFCGQVFRRVGSRLQHQRDVHLGTRCFWPGCGAVMASELELRRHLRRHHDDIVTAGWRPEKCSWPGCGKVLSRRGTAHRCVRSHHQEQRRRR